jgi:hypothetical protein
MNNLTSKLNQQSIENMKQQIRLKTSPNPYFATNKTVLNTITDMDHFPYTRYYRGVYYHPDPIVMEREAGWRNINNSCYEQRKDIQKEEEPKHCFEVACTTNFPCYPSYFSKYADKNELDVMINNACIIEYR